MTCERRCRRIVAMDTLDLRGTSELQLTGTLLGVWAHPDDETYLSAGLMLRAARSGARVVCATATRGELGTDDHHAWPPARLGERRVRELRTALAQVGVRESRRLELRDGACAEVHPDDGTAMIQALIDEVQPDTIVTFGPDGITGHPDHVAVSQWTTDAWLGTGQLSTLLYATMTPAFLRRHARLHRRIGLFPEGYPRPALGTDSLYEVALDRGELRRKRAALAAHSSQTEPLVRAMGESTFTHWWATETFRLPRLAEIQRRRAPALALQHAG
jgi:LmbE family N-acetylglucosaminyl deacetylase